MKTTTAKRVSQVETLVPVKAASLRNIRPEQAARVVRRIVGNEPQARRLDVAVFNSAV